MNQPLMLTAAQKAGPKVTIAMGVVILVVCAQSVPFVAQAGADTVERWVKGAAALDRPETYRKPPY